MSEGFAIGPGVVVRDCPVCVGYGFSVEADPPPADMPEMPFVFTGRRIRCKRCKGKGWITPHEQEHQS